MRKMYVFNKKDNLIYKIMSKVLKKYTQEVYKRGVLVGFNWNNDVDNVNNLSTIHKLK